MLESKYIEQYANKRNEDEGDINNILLSLVGSIGSILREPYLNDSERVEEFSKVMELYQMDMSTWFYGVCEFRSLLAEIKETKMANSA